MCSLLILLKHNDTGSPPIAVNYFTCKKGVSKKSATPGSVFDRTTGGGGCTVLNIQFSIRLRSHGILKKWSWKVMKRIEISFPDLRGSPECVRVVPSAEMAASAVCSKKGAEMVHE